MDQSHTEKLVHAFVTSRLDYCNSLFAGSYNYQFRKLQHIQNAAARLVVRRKLDRHADMTPILQELHWLPVVVHVEFKILCIVFKLIRHSESAPHYVKELISVHIPNIHTKSCEGLKLNYPNVRPNPSKAYGDRDFTIYAPVVWNSLPAFLRNINEFDIFKVQLKTFLFRRCYNV